MPCPPRLSLMILLAALSLGGCARMPDLGPEAASAARSTSWPALAPIAELHAAAASLPDATQYGTAADALDARAAALRQRAAALRGPTIDPATLKRLDEAAGTPAN